MHLCVHMLRTWSYLPLYQENQALAPDKHLPLSQDMSPDPKPCCAMQKQITTAMHVGRSQDAAEPTKSKTVILSPYEVATSLLLHQKVRTGGRSAVCVLLSRAHNAATE